MFAAQQALQFAGLKMCSFDLKEMIMLMIHWMVWPQILASFLTPIPPRNISPPSPAAQERTGYKYKSELGR